ncbi:MAG: type II secretion system protein GspM [Deltaproteobacteria bacterium]|nr:type II secretion system protein GspM [Deltaproteobacteria bacterium]
MNLSFLTKASISKRKFLWIFIAVAVALGVYTLLIVPLVEAKKKADQEIALTQRLLQKYVEVLQNRKTVEEGLDRILKQGEEIQKRLLVGETPQLGAANLQDMVKRLAEKNSLAIRSFRSLDPKEAGSFRRISVQIEFNPMSSMQGLAQFLYEVEHQEKKITISEMDLLVFNPRMPNTIQGNMIISAYMKGNKGKEREKEKGREKP